MRNERIDPAVAGLRVENGLPVRRFYSWPGKPNKEGRWWSSTMQAHVAHESLLEREYLLIADYVPQIIAVVSQPVALLWPTGIPGHRYHVPDFFVRYSDGGGRLVDVRTPTRLAESRTQFAMTSQACREIGWEYEVFTGSAPGWIRNLEWIGRYRHPRYAPEPSLAQQITGLLAYPVCLDVGIRAVAAAAAIPRAQALQNIYHLLWHQRLAVDLSAGELSMDTVVHA
ncbi:TnsA-like heteromeric transposase endonuclease subunit [Nocardia salmonicida]|uniref:TnsA-like heteromeric transposase endonuclease subunit n=1 Tax=Nocardia salmonicida TaxID=53431 RepID=UPI0037B40C56